MIAYVLEFLALLAIVVSTFVVGVTLALIFSYVLGADK